MLRSIHYEPSCDKTCRGTTPAGRSSPPIAPFFGPMATALWAMFAALREGLAAYRRYEHLRSRGMPHETALAAAVGSVPGPARMTRRTVKRSVFVAGTPAGAKPSEAVTALVDFLKSPAAIAAIKAKGMQVD